MNAKTMRRSLVHGQWLSAGVLILCLATVFAGVALGQQYTFSTLAGQAGAAGSTDGTGAAARFNTPIGIDMDGSNLRVADTLNHTLRTITPAGVVWTYQGSAGVTGTNDGSAATRFRNPYGVAIGPDGNTYTADGGNHTVRKTAGSLILWTSTLAGLGGSSGTADGTGTVARFNSPSGIAVDGATNSIVTDWFNHSIRKVTPAGVVTTIAGLSGTSGSADGNGTAARFKNPGGVAIGPLGQIYVADTENHAIRKISYVFQLFPLPGYYSVTTLAGLSGTSGFADGTGSAARFSSPQGIAVDTAGNVFVADSANHAIRKITTAGVVTTVGGLGTVSGSANGVGSAARFYRPKGITVDSVGNLYVADSWNQTIRMGTISSSWSTGAVNMGGSWKWLAWFGFFADMGSNWIWHPQLGFMYSPPTSTPESILFYTSSMGWLWTSSTVYSSFYRFSNASWYWYQQGSSAPQYWYNYSTAAWETH